MKKLRLNIGSDEVFLWKFCYVFTKNKCKFVFKHEK